jgi:hypothetical protein
LYKGVSQYSFLDAIAYGVTPIVRHPH